MLKMDKNKLAQVVRNLVSNALKFSKRGSSVIIAMSRQQTQRNFVQIPASIQSHIIKNYVSLFRKVGVVNEDVHDGQIGSNALESSLVPPSVASVNNAEFQPVGSFASVQSFNNISEGSNDESVGAREGGPGALLRNVALDSADADPWEPVQVERDRDLDLEANIVLEEEKQGAGWLRMDVTDFGPGIAKVRCLWAVICVDGVVEVDIISVF